mmetsp:Transcript_51740/g.59440  ORF Transcript_51740/g.59440 Transcript_51740/m.59440 type:complete len:342 (+) Transcript_51740:79-1104(+)
MLRRARLWRFTSSWGNDRTAQSRAVKGVGGEREKVFQKGGNVHMYASKENAWEGFTDDRFYGLKRLKEYWRRLLRDRGIRYYLFGTIIIMGGAGGKLWSMQEELKRETGLLGPKKKHFRSRLTVVLDLDETIVSYGDKAFRMRAGMVPRPYLAELLDFLCEIDAEVILWSACSDRYMKQVLQVIDPSGQRITQTITRSNDWFTHDHFYEKNLAWIKRNMNDVVMIENRALAARNCNANTILVDDFIRGEYMDTGQDHPVHDRALKVVKEVLQDLEKSGRPVAEYLADTEKRHKEIKEIPCHLAVRQLPDEIARGVYYFIGDKFRPNRTVPLKSDSMPQSNR